MSTCLLLTNTRNSLLLFRTRFKNETPLWMTTYETTVSLHYVQTLGIPREIVVTDLDNAGKKTKLREIV